LKLQRKIKEEPTVDLTSLSDVVFLLLIFFMVSTSFEHQAVLKVDLPEASSVEPPNQQAERLELIIDAAGLMYLNDRQLINSDARTLQAALEEAAGTRRDLPLTLRADRLTPHHFVVTSMDVAAELGFRNLSIATDRSTGNTE
jgi:biopolymer transport protein ExbD